MILDTLITVGAFGTKAVIKTAEVVGPATVKAGKSVSNFTRKEVALAKAEASKQKRLIVEDYNKAAKTLAASTDDFMAAWNKDIELATAK